jgi:hypothetical protein
MKLIHILLFTRFVCGWSKDKYYYSQIPMLATIAASIYNHSKYVTDCVIVVIFIRTSQIDLQIPSTLFLSDINSKFPWSPRLLLLSEGI